MQPLTQHTYRATRVTPLSEHTEADHIDLRIGRDVAPKHEVMCKECDRPECRMLARTPLIPLLCERSLMPETNFKRLPRPQGKKGHLTPRQREIVQWLAEHGPSPACDLERAFCYTKGSMAAQLNIIRQAGYIVRGPKLNKRITWVVMEE